MVSIVDLPSASILTIDIDAEILSRNRFAIEDTEDDGSVFQFTSSFPVVLEEILS